MVGEEAIVLTQPFSVGSIFDTRVLWLEVEDLGSYTFVMAATLAALASFFTCHRIVLPKPKNLPEVNFPDGASNVFQREASKARCVLEICHRIVLPKPKNLPEVYISDGASNVFQREASKARYVLEICHRIVLPK